MAKKAIITSNGMYTLILSVHNLYPDDKPNIFWKRIADYLGALRSGKKLANCI
jgi:hypothetical protein